MPNFFIAKIFNGWNFCFCLLQISERTTDASKSFLFYGFWKAQCGDSSFSPRQVWSFVEVLWSQNYMVLSTFFNVFFLKKKKCNLPTCLVFMFLLRYQITFFKIFFKIFFSKIFWKILLCLRCFFGIFCGQVLFCNIFPRKN